MKLLRPLSVPAKRLWTIYIPSLVNSKSADCLLCYSRRHQEFGKRNHDQENLWLEMRDVLAEVGLFCQNLRRIVVYLIDLELAIIICCRLHFYEVL